MRIIHATNLLDSLNLDPNSLITNKAKARRVLAEKDATIASLREGGALGDVTRGDNEHHFE